MATYQIEWKNSAVKELKRLDRQVVPRIISTVESLAANPRPESTRKLCGSQHTYRIRVGDYRVIYEVFESRLVVHIIRVRHRKDVYR